MNDDLVERLTVHGLRDGSMKEQLLIEAQDELTRLRKENERYNAAVLRMGDEIVELRGEVRRLTASASPGELPLTDDRIERAATVIFRTEQSQRFPSPPLTTPERARRVLMATGDYTASLAEPTEGGTKESLSGATEQTGEKR